MYLVKTFVADKNTYLLLVTEYQNINPDKMLLGYYDDEYIYIIPNDEGGIARAIPHKDRLTALYASCLHLGD